MKVVVLLVLVVVEPRLDVVLLDVDVVLVACTHSAVSRHSPRPLASQRSQSASYAPASSPPTVQTRSSASHPVFRQALRQRSSASRSPSQRPTQLA